MDSFICAEKSLHTEIQLSRLPRTAISGQNLILPGVLNFSPIWVEKGLHTEFQLPRLPGTASFRLILFFLFFFFFLGGGGDPNFVVPISFSWFKISLHTEFQLLGCLELLV